MVSAAVRLSDPQIAELRACWNTAYRRIGFKHYESVCTFIAGLGKLDFDHLRALRFLCFIRKSLLSDNSLLHFLSNLHVLSDYFRYVCTSFCVDPELFCDVGFGRLLSVI